VELLGRYVEMRPLIQDTVSRSLVEESENGNLFYGDYPVYCSGGETCDYWRSRGVQGATALTADLTFTAWGLGITGLSATATLRVRDNNDSEFLWPRTDDSFDAMLAYLQYVNGGVRVRAGRLRTLSGLGFSGYDGLSAWWEPTRWLRVEGYGGRSLARGLYDPRNEILSGLENFHTDQDADLFGAFAEFEPQPGSTISLRYQREIWRDRSALLSERASVDARTVALHPVVLLASADWDFAFATVGKAHLTAQVPIRSAGLLIEATARRYRPYFELWTIWGYFSPAAYHEGELRVTWSLVDDLSVHGLAGYRTYADAYASSTPWGELETDARRFGGGLTWTPGDDWLLEGRYEFVCCSGAYISTGDARVRWSPHWRVTLGAFGMAFQQIEEFRIGEGVGVGGGATLELGITRRAFLTGGISGYQHVYSESQPATADWNQMRGWAGLRVDFGGDPGMAAVRRRRP
jgi:hypothetical protein